jgi:hypothetical protein
MNAPVPAPISAPRSAHAGTRRPALPAQAHLDPAHVGAGDHREQSPAALVHRHRVRPGTAQQPGDRAPRPPGRDPRARVGGEGLGRSRSCGGRGGEEGERDEQRRRTARRAVGMEGLRRVTGGSRAAYDGGADAPTAQAHGPRAGWRGCTRAPGRPRATLPLFLQVWSASRPGRSRYHARATVGSLRCYAIVGRAHRQGDMPELVRDGGHLAVRQTRAVGAELSAEPLPARLMSRRERVVHDAAAVRVSTLGGGQRRGWHGEDVCESHRESASKSPARACFSRSRTLRYRGVPRVIITT